MGAAYGAVHRENSTRTRDNWSSHWCSNDNTVIALSHCVLQDERQRATMLACIAFGQVIFQKSFACLRIGWLHTRVMHIWCIRGTPAGSGSNRNSDIGGAAMAALAAALRASAAMASFSTFGSDELGLEFGRSCLPCCLCNGSDLGVDASQRSKGVGMKLLLQVQKRQCGS